MRTDVQRSYILTHPFVRRAAQHVIRLMRHYSMSSKASVLYQSAACMDKRVLPHSLRCGGAMPRLSLLFHAALPELSMICRVLRCHPCGGYNYTRRQRTQAQ